MRIHCATQSAARELPDGFPALADGKRFHQHQDGEMLTQDPDFA